MSFAGFYSEVQESGGKLFRGRKFNFSEAGELKKLGVTLVVDFRAYTRFNCRMLEHLFCKLKGIKYINFPHHFRATIPTREQYEGLVKIIRENEGCAYVHCRNGRHRTGLFVAAYNMIEHRKNYDKAFSEDVLAYHYVNRTKKELPKVKSLHTWLEYSHAKHNNQKLGWIIGAAKSFKSMFGT